MGDKKSPKEQKETSAKTKSPTPKEQASQLPASPITEDTPGIYFEKVTSGRP